jgi:hypothetical protein
MMIMSSGEKGVSQHNRNLFERERLEVESIEEIATR